MNAPQPASALPLAPHVADPRAINEQRIAGVRARLAIAFAVLSVSLLAVPGMWGSRYHGNMPPAVAITITLAVLAALALNVMGAIFGVLCLRARPRSNVAIIGACLGLGSIVVPLGIAIIVALLAR